MNEHYYAEIASQRLLFLDSFTNAQTELRQAREELKQARARILALETELAEVKKAKPKARAKSAAPRKAG